MTDTLTDMENTPVNDRLEAIEGELSQLVEQVTALREELAPIAPFLAELPELMGKIGPLFEALKESPVLKMIGVRL